jgi:hypothetical protein
VLVWVAVGRAIGRYLRPRSNARRGRMPPSVLMTLAGVFALMSFIALTAQDAPTCAGTTMVAGDVCRRADGSTETYEARRQSSHSARILWGTIGGVAAVGLLSFGLIRRSAIRDARAVVAQARSGAGASPAPQTYDWSPESLFSATPVHERDVGRHRH